SARDSLLVRQQLEQAGEQRGDETRMWINAVRVVDRAVPHCEHAPPRAHRHGRLEVQCPDVLAVVAQPLRRLAEQLAHVELFSDDAGYLLPAERVAGVEQEVAAARRAV